MMKFRVFIVALIISLSFSSCLKDGYQTFSCNAALPKVTVPTAELQALEAYLSQQGITNAVKYQEAFYYKIETQGTGNNPTICSNVTIYYQGKLIDGTTFDQTGNTPANFPLSNLITGWQLGLPLIKAGGKIKLYLPPTLCYGNRVVGNIPANSILIFEVSLVAA
jgi:FKBP-type peptidyl-prolyl cis-trans isomerase FkpA